MSRIDEALKRASELAEGPRPVTDRVRSDKRETVLTDYPLEEARGQHLLVPESRSELELRPARFFDRTEAAFQGKLVLNGARQSLPVAVEQYRRLAATLHELQVERGLKTVMVTSAVPQEGKTLTVANLALTLSGSYGRRVVLVDADLRRPSVYKVFGISNDSGLSDTLRGRGPDLTIEEVLPRLSVVPGGTPDANPMAGLTSDRMRGLLEDLAARFDWVLLDAPPVGLLPDGQLLARLARAVIFVVRAGTTPFQVVERAMTELGRDYIVGTVLNRAAEDTVPATGYYSHYYRTQDSG